MGPTQGKLETINTIAIVAEASGKTLDEIGTTTWRPRTRAIGMGRWRSVRPEPVIADGSTWHEAHNAQPLVAGKWIRPEHYGDPQAEVANTRTNVGIIDVTPLGKYLLYGSDTPNLLNFLYVNSWSDLPVGSAQYGLMTLAMTILLRPSDGVTARLSADEYFMTTTSSGISGTSG